MRTCRWPSCSRPQDEKLAFQVEGAGEMFYEARLRYARKELPRDSIDRGFFVRKLLRSVSPEGVGDALATLPSATQTSVPAGRLVLVDLVVVSPTPREQVVIDDPLPAGLEPVDTTFTTTAASLDVTGMNGEGDRDDDGQSDDDAVASDQAWTFAWYHREMHDDRVLTFVEHMPAGMLHYRYLARATTAGTFVVPANEGGVHVRAGSVRTDGRVAARGAFAVRGVVAALAWGWMRCKRAPSRLCSIGRRPRSRARGTCCHAGFAPGARARLSRPRSRSGSWIAKGARYVELPRR